MNDQPKPKIVPNLMVCCQCGSPVTLGSDKESFIYICKEHGPVLAYQQEEYIRVQKAKEPCPVCKDKAEKKL